MMVLDPVIQLILLALILVWLVVLTALTFKQLSFLNRLSRGQSKTSLEAILKQLLTEQDSASARIQEIVGHVEQLKGSAQSHFQKIGFIRFNPYADTGGNQSFCLCLLNDYNDGIVITSLHSREQTRIYAKQVSHDTVDQKDFSKEEIESIKQAKSISKKSK